MQQTTALQRINDLRGMEELKVLGNKLHRVAKNKSELFYSHIQLPNYLFIEDPGCGVTTHLRMLTDLLHEYRLIDFEGDRKFFEWILDDAAFSDHDGAFERLLDEIAINAGFHARFKGVIGLDVDAWKHKADNEAFLKVLNLAEDCLGEILFVYIVQADKNGDPNNLITQLASKMPLEVVHCPLPSTDDLALYLVDFLERRTFEVSAAAESELKTLLPKLEACKAFDGFQTLDNLADEIVYHCCAAALRDARQPIEPADLTFITAEGGYIDRLSAKGVHGNKRAIGFRSGT